MESKGVSGSPPAMRWYATQEETQQQHYHALAHNLATALGSFRANCTEFGRLLDPDALAMNLHMHADQCKQLGAHTTRTALALEVADSGGFPWLLDRMATEARQITATSAQQQPSPLDKWLDQLAAATQQGKLAVQQAVIEETLTTILLSLNIVPGGPYIDADGNLLRLDLTLAEFEMLTAAERIQWVEALERRADAPNWFHNIQDIIAFFDESPSLHHMRRGSWASWADAGVLEAMQNGFVLHNATIKGLPIPPGFNDCNGAAQAWQKFFDGRLDGQDDKYLIPLWSIAEQMGVNYGSVEANRKVGLPAPGTAEGDLLIQFVGYGNMYRFIAHMENGGADFAQGYAGDRANELGSNVMIGIGLIDPAVYIIRLFGGDEAVKEYQKTQAEAAGALAEMASDSVSPAGGAWFFDPRSLPVPDGLDMYTDSSQLPQRGLNTTLVPIADELRITNGPTYYMAHAVEKGYTDVLAKLFPGITVDPITGVLVLENGTTLLPDGTAQLVDGTVFTPDGWVIKPDGTRIPLAGTRFDADGNYILSDGTVAR